MAKIDDADLLKEARERFDLARTAEFDNDQEAMDDLDFLSNDQWDADTRSSRESDNRPCLTFNQLPQFIRQVTGEIRINKPAVKVHPVDEGADVETAEIYAGLIRHIEAASDADVAYQTGAQNSTACGKGAWRVICDHYDKDSWDQDVRIEPIHNPFAVYWDIDAVKYTREDAMWCFVIEEMSLAAYKSAYPKASLSEFDSATQTQSMRAWGTDKEMRIAEYWTKEPITRTLAKMRDGSTLDLTDMSEPERAALDIADTREVEDFKIMCRIISGAEVLEGPWEHPGKYIPIVPVWGEEWHLGGRVVRNGLIRYAKDPQRMLNYHMSAAVEVVALTPKAPFVGTVEQFRGLEKHWKQANTKNLPFLPYNPDPSAPGAPQRQPGAEVPVAMLQLAQMASDSMKAGTGIYGPSQGAQSNETSGRAINARQREGDVGIFAFIDNLARSIRYTGRILVDLIPRIYDGERVVRILGEDETEEMRPINIAVGRNPDGTVQYANDITVGKYDVSISTGPSYSTRRAEASDSMLAFMKAVPEAAGLIGDLIAKNQDWPGADDIAERLHRLAVAKGIAEPDEGDQPPPPDPAAVAKENEFKMKALEAQAKMTAEGVKTEGVELDNAQKKLDLAVQTGGIEGMVKAEVQRLIMQAISETRDGMGAPVNGGGIAPGP